MRRPAFAGLHGGAGHQAVGVVDPETAVLPLATDAGELGGVLAGLGVVVGLGAAVRSRVGADAHGVEEADGGEDRRTAAQQIGVRADRLADQGDTGAVRREGVGSVVPYAVQGARVEEVDLEVVVALGAQGGEDLGQVGRRGRVRGVQDVQVVAPVAARVQGRAVEGPDEPVGVGLGEFAARVDQERCRPDARPAASRADGVGDAGAGAEAAGESEPVAEGALVAVVDLDDVDGEVEGVHRTEVLVDVVLGDGGEVLVPGAPDGGRRPRGREAEAVRPVRQHRLDVGAGQRLHRPVGADLRPVVPYLQPDGRHGPQRVGRRPQPDRRAVARVEGQESLPWKTPAGTVCPDR